ncbi:MAG: Biotin synthase [Alphaproteobacteria bacterium MarineAlpha9_Bin2]|nr:MAG: Biotin synthase [Alphaproteobacteria bacterium MarineAlpha9_Bin2]
MINKNTSFKNTIRHNWDIEESIALISKPILELVYEAQTLHRLYFKKNKIQMSKLLSIKTGSCPEDCAYCPQSAHYNVELKQEPLMSLEKVKKAAQKAYSEGATRFCLGAAWRGPTDKDLDKVCEMVAEVKALGMESCVTLGLLKDGQAEKLAKAGLDYYNHNIDSSEEYYGSIISTRNFQDRLDTLRRVRQSGLKVCCGGIVGMRESREDRADMLRTLANLDKHPESVPINLLIKIPGTPLEKVDDLNPIELVRVIAAAKIMMPKSTVRLSAGRASMSTSTQTLCFMAGASSIFMGDVLLTAENSGDDEDKKMFQQLGLVSEKNIEIKKL